MAEVKQEVESPQAWTCPKCGEDKECLVILEEVMDIKYRIKCLTCGTVFENMYTRVFIGQMVLDDDGAVVSGKGLGLSNLPWKNMRV